jgi:uncharacterized protein (DUF2062 family)
VPRQEASVIGRGAPVGWRRRLRGRIEPIFGLNEAPHRTAAALALGVFFGFSPFLGLQTIAAFTCVALFRFNPVVVFCGLNMNLPWILVPWYVGTTWLGATVVGVSPERDLAPQLRILATLPFWHGQFLSALWGMMDALSWPFLVGPTISAGVLAAAAFWLTRALLVRRVKSQPQSD